MFLIRMAFWLALIVMVLPSDPQKQAQLYQTAAHTVHRAATFCDRNAALCTQAGQHWAVFRTKLEFGAKLVFDVASERLFGVQHAVDRSGEAPPAGHPPTPQRPANGRVGA